MRDKIAKSPSNTYVAICNKSNFDGYYFRKFTLPQDEEMVKILKREHCVRDAAWKLCSCGKCEGCIYVAERIKEGVNPAWYYLNVLNLVACITEVITFEDYCSIKDEDEIKAETQKLVYGFRDSKGGEPGRVETNESVSRE